MRDMREMKNDDTKLAITMLSEIRDAWLQIKPE
jgi:hypothetical protein